MNRSVIIALSCLAAGLVIGTWLYEPPADPREALKQTEPEAVAAALSPEDIRHPEPGIARISQGPPEDPSLLPTTPIAPWDNSVMFSWIEHQVKQLEGKITDPEILRLAAEAEAQARDRTSQREFYRSANTGIELAFYGVDPVHQRNGLYIMYKAALAGRDEPFVFHHLGNYFEDHRTEPGFLYRAAFWRQAADRDFLPSLINTVWLMEADGKTSPGEVEAYLRYGIDLDAEDGGWNILGYVRDFYLKHPEMESDGYLNTVVKRYREYGDEAAAGSLEYEMSRRDIDVPADPVAEFEAARRAFAAGDDRFAAHIGRAYLGGKVVPQDRELARDYFMACLRSEDPVSPCAYGLAEIYGFGPEANLPVAVALWYHASDLPIGMDIDAAEHGFNLIAPLPGQLNDQQKAETSTYLAAMRADDYAAVPGVKDARPVPERKER